MAEHYNKIQIARGDKGKKNPILGELFYDYKTRGVYIGAGDSLNPVWRRFGGFDSIIVKGTLGANTNLDELTLEAGDAYIVTGPISVEQPEIIFGENGSVTRGKNFREYDNFFKAGQIIVYVDEDVSTLPNSYVIDNTTKYGFIALSGGENASDIENDTKFAPVAAKATSPTDGLAGLDDVQSALDYLFNNKIEYKGTTTNVEFSADELDEFFSEDDFFNAVANKNKLDPGEFIIYNGNTKKIDLSNDVSFNLKKHTVIIKVAKVTSNTNDAAALDTTVFTFILGGGDSTDIEVAFTGSRKSSEAISSVNTLSISNDLTSIDNDEDVSTIQQAIDVLHQTKADLNSQGKIPLSQIPNTFIGALQYIGTVNFDNTVTEISAIDFAKAMSNLNGADSMEKEGEGVNADVAFERVDAGDYVIVKVEASIDQELKSQVKVVTGAGEDDFFLVSEGDHVICNSVTYDDEGNITDVTLDHLDTSARVDSVNGVKADVNIDGSLRTVDTSLTDSPNNNSVIEVSITTMPNDHKIKISAPNAVLAKDDLTKNVIPVGNGAKALLNSEIKINGQENPSEYHSDENPDHNTELVGKKSDGTNVVIEFPDESGKIITRSKVDSGTKDRLSKFDADGNLIDSDIEQISADKTIKILDDNNEKLIELNYGDLASLFKFAKGELADTTFRFDGNYGDGILTELRNDDEKTHTILDDCSTIDGGEWV